MRRHKLSISLVIMLAMFTAVVLPTTAYAFSWNDLLNINLTNRDSTNIRTSGNSLTDTILGLLIGKLLGNVGKISSGLADKIPLPASLDTANSSKEVVGFYAEWWDTDTASFRSLSQNVDTIRTIAPFWATLHEDGTLTNRGGNDHAAVVNFAHPNNISVLLLVNNAKQESADIPIHKVLSNPSLRAKAIDNLENYIKKYNLDGVNIDFEMVPAQDRANLTLFMKELSQRLKSQGYIISIDVFPKQDETNDVSVAYDYEQLAKYADKIMLMTYDNHGVWSSTGPIADVKWVEKNLKYALQFIPKSKVYLGIAGYGYDWSNNGVEALEYAPAMNLVQRFNASIKWDEQSKSPYFSYTGSDGVNHQVWYENAASLKYKLDLVTKYDIAGVALWKLGGEDPQYWPILKEKLLNR